MHNINAAANQFFLKYSTLQPFRPKSQKYKYHLTNSSPTEFYVNQSKETEYDGADIKLIVFTTRT